MKCNISVLKSSVIITQLIIFLYCYVLIYINMICYWNLSSFVDDYRVSLPSIKSIQVTRLMWRMWDGLSMTAYWWLLAVLTQLWWFGRIFHHKSKVYHPASLRREVFQLHIFTFFAQSVLCLQFFVFNENLPSEPSNGSFFISKK